MKKSIEKWLKEPQYATILKADFARGSSFFDGNHATKKMDEAEFQSRMKMAAIKYKTKKYKKIPMEVDACQVGKDMTLTTPRGNVVVREGDYIIYDQKGEPHPMSKENFEKIYQLI